MVPAPIPDDEDARLAALHQCKILDTGFDQSFDRLVQLISRVLQVPIVLVSLVDEHRQWFKARVGLDVSETPRDISFCGHAILDSSTMVVEDATTDERFKDNPLVVGAPHIRFYAGSPIVTKDGHRLGTVCAIDSKARTPSQDEIQFLEQIAKIASAEMAALSAISEAIESRNVLGRAIREKDHLIAYLAHDIRSPLGAMLGFAELLSLDKQAPLAPKQLERVKTIMAAGNQILTLVDEILHQSQLREGEITAHLAPTNVPKLINQTVLLFEPLAARTGIKLSVDVKSTPEALVDSVWLTQILTNLISNAIKYNRKDGMVTVGYGAKFDGRVLLTVADTGIGIPDEKRHDLFKPYNRLGRECTQADGTGLGLSIVKRLVELMGGNIAAENVPSGGTIFSVELPTPTLQSDAADREGDKIEAAA